MASRITTPRPTTPHSSLLTPNCIKPCRFARFRVRKTLRARNREFRETPHNTLTINDYYFSAIQRNSYGAAKGILLTGRTNHSALPNEPFRPPERLPRQGGRIPSAWPAQNCDPSARLRACPAMPQTIHQRALVGTFRLSKFFQTEGSIRRTNTTARRLPACLEELLHERAALVLEHALRHDRLRMEGAGGKS